MRTYKNELSHNQNLQNLANIHHVACDQLKVYGMRLLTPGIRGSKWYVKGLYSATDLQRYIFHPLANSTFKVHKKRNTATDRQRNIIFISDINT